MRTLKIASVLALCGAANLAHAADIPGVLGDPGTTTQATEPEDQPTTVTTDRQFINIFLTREKAWGFFISVDLDILELNDTFNDGYEYIRCIAFTRAYDPETKQWSTVDRLYIHYGDDPDKAGVHIRSDDPLNPNASSQLDIGNRTLQLTNVYDNTATFTSRKNRIDLIEAIMRGRTATFSSHGPNGFIQRTFSLAGATAMAELAARACDANSANPGKSNPTPTASRKTTSQPSQQARTTTQQRQQTQTTTQYEDDPGCAPGFDQDTGMAIMEESIASDDLLGVFVGGMMMGLDC